MKTYVELSLVALLIALLYQPPQSLTFFAKSVLGKAALIILTIMIASQFGVNAGLLSALITIVLLNNNKEGFEFFSGVNPNKKDLDSYCALYKDGECPFGGTAKTGGRRSSSTDANIPTQRASISGSESILTQLATDKKVKKAKVSAPVEEKKEEPKKEEPKKEEPKKEEPKKEEPKKEEPKKEEEEKAEAKKEKFSNYTLDNAADYPNLKSTLCAVSTNDNIMRSMRASEYAKTAPGGTALLTNHIVTNNFVNKGPEQLVREGFMR